MKTKFDTVFTYRGVGVTFGNEHTNGYALTYRDIDFTSNSPDISNMRDRIEANPFALSALLHRTAARETLIKLAIDAYFDDEV